MYIMNKFKLAIIMGTRPEIIRLSMVIKKSKNYFDLLLIHTGQNYDKNLKDIFFEDLELQQPDIYLNVVGGNFGETMGNILSKSHDVLLEHKPNALLVLGDTNSCLSAIIAKRLKIPIFHMEAGNRCFDLNVPEEINRKIVDHIADINLPYTENSRKYLINEGFTKDNIFVTGSPMAEILEHYKDKIDNSKILEKYNLEKNNYFVISAHREENIDIENKFTKLINILNHIANKYDKKMIFSVHPRTLKKLKDKKIIFNENIIIIEPENFCNYCCLQKNSYVVLSDSGTLAEESAILQFSSISLRTSTERPEVFDKGNMVLCNLNIDIIDNCIELALKLNKNNIIPYDYKETNTSDRIINIIFSYTDIIRTRTYNL